MTLLTTQSLDFLKRWGTQLSVLTAIQVRAS